jgi:glucose/arabinose dehydrogenase
MRNISKWVQATAVLASLGIAGGIAGCGSSTDGGGIPTGSGALIQFTSVGDAVSTDLIDLEFLPGTNGEAVVIGKGGTVYYMRKDFTFMADRPAIDVSDDGEQGLLNVAADPDYANNHFIYLFHTIKDTDSTGPGNQVRRYTVTVDVAGDSFSIAPGPVIVAADKTAFGGTGSNHNGGSLVFDDTGRLYVGFGDGGGGLTGLNNDPDVSQDPGTNLGKVLRITGVSTDSPSVAIFAWGLRNPFTMAFGDGGLFIGDVGSNAYEEIDFAPVSASDVNFGWNRTEGPTTASGVMAPIHGYAHGDNAFIDEDPEARGGGGDSIMAGAFYTGSQYGGALTHRFLYSEFFAGWVRSFGLGAPPITADSVTDDKQTGHNTGMTSLQQGPDGFLYGVSLFNSDRILRVDLR